MTRAEDRSGEKWSALGLDVLYKTIGCEPHVLSSALTDGRFETLHLIWRYSNSPA
jgi:hypothetical protein